MHVRKRRPLPLGQPYLVHGHPFLIFTCVRFAAQNVVPIYQMQLCLCHSLSFLSSSAPFMPAPYLQVLQRLQEACPLICHTVKFGTHSDGRFFIVMHVGLTVNAHGLLTQRNT